MNHKPVVIVGPTASGKSSVAMAVAQAETSVQNPVHIVAVDAMQVYRDMNIGTAKPTLQDQSLVPHHCLDLVDSHERFTVAEFKKSATVALDEIAKVEVTDAARFHLSGHLVEVGDVPTHKLRIAVSSSN